MKKIAIMGSSGSIGKSTLDVIRNYPDRFSVSALCVHANTTLLKEQIAEFRPAVVAVGTEALADQLRKELGPGTEIRFGIDGYLEIAKSADYDIFVGAMVGFAGLAPTIEAVKRGKRIALANKETLVVAGELVTKLCREYNAELLPVDSEHSALFQCLQGENTPEVKKFIITASGGPFFTSSKAQLEQVTVEQALNHPTWKMGSKITIDSATMMNKGLEVIEARWLFDFPIDKIDVVIHPQSIIHSMIEFVDGSIKAQLSTPDMRIPIQYALSYPERLPGSYVQTQFPSLKALTFHEPDFDKFACLQLAFDAIAEGGLSPCILNAANEVAVTRFLKGEINFLKIPYIIHSALATIEKTSAPCLDDIFTCDLTTRRFAELLQ
jgi:1-deoxy-D-xylulose-5-phosphate reductoisomerase